VRVDPAAQQRLLKLAGIDAELDRIGHKRRTLPELAEIIESEKTAQENRDAVVAAETAAGDLDRDIRRMERDVDAVRTRQERDRQLLTAGVSAKQTVDLQHELETLARRQGNLEDELLEVMEQREAVGQDIEHARVTLAGTEKRLVEAGERRDTALADLDADEQGRTRDRAATLDGLPAELLAEYDRLRSKQGIGAAAIRERRCGSCRLELDRTTIGRLRAADAEEVVHCEECGTILVRTPESGL
jgi:hypothetical protein